MSSIPQWVVEQFNQSGASVQGLVTFTGRPGYLSWAMHLKPGILLCSVATVLHVFASCVGGSCSIFLLNWLTRS